MINSPPSCVLLYNSISPSLTWSLLLSIHNFLLGISSSVPFSGLHAYSANCLLKCSTRLPPNLTLHMLQIQLALFPSKLFFLPQFLVLVNGATFYSILGARVFGFTGDFSLSTSEGWLGTTSSASSAFPPELCAALYFHGVCLSSGFRHFSLDPHHDFPPGLPGEDITPCPSVLLKCSSI